MVSHVVTLLPKGYAVVTGSENRTLRFTLYRPKTFVTSHYPTAQIAAITPHRRCSTALREQRLCRWWGGAPFMRESRSFATVHSHARTGSRRAVNHARIAHRTRVHPYVLDTKVPAVELFLLLPRFSNWIMVLGESSTYCPILC